MSLPPGFAAIDFDAHHIGALAEWATAERGRVAARAASHLSSLGLQLPNGAAYTYVPAGGMLRIVGGTQDADAVIELDLESWQGLVHDIEAPAGLIYSGRARALRGSAIALMQWETPLRVLYQGRRPYDPTVTTLRDDQGRTVDPQRSFRLDDDPAEMAAFLAVAGYLLLRGVFSADEVERFRDAATVLRREARPGDKLSWWGKNARGEEILCRVTRGASQPDLAALRDDPRLLALAGLSREPLAYRRGEGDGVAVIFKHPDVSEGLADLPWHRDCGLGGHAILCPTAVASVFLTAGNAATGELRFLPGSRHTAFNAHDPQCRGALPAACFAAEPGDVTLHYGDTIHGAPPPAPGQPQYRASAIIGYARPDGHTHQHASSYNEALHQRDDGQVEHLDALARRR